MRKLIFLVLICLAVLLPNIQLTATDDSDNLIATFSIIKIANLQAKAVMKIVATDVQIENRKVHQKPYNELLCLRKLLIEYIGILNPIMEKYRNETLIETDCQSVMRKLEEFSKRLENKTICLKPLP